MILKQKDEKIDDSDNEYNDYLCTSHSATPNYSSDSTILSSKETEDIEEALHNAVKNITERLNEADQIMTSGVKKFIKSYTYMQHSSFAPTATISHTLHNFGKSDSN